MLGLLMPLWGRAALSSAVLSYWARPEYDHIFKVAVISPEDDDPPDIPPTFKVVWHHNDMQPKWQAGFDAMRGHCDAVMMMGSDDLMTPGLVDYLHEAALGCGMSHPTSCYWADPVNMRMAHVTYRTVFGGCTYSMEIAEQVEGDLFTDSTKNPPDVVSATKAKHIMRRLRRDWHKTPRLDEIDEALVDIKTPVNVWSYDDMVGRAERKGSVVSYPDYKEFFAKYFPDFVY